MQDPASMRKEHHFCADDTFPLFMTHDMRLNDGGCTADPLAKIAPHKKRKRGKNKGPGASGNAAGGAANGAGPAAEGTEGPGASALKPWLRETSVQLAVLHLHETLLQVSFGLEPQTLSRPHGLNPCP